MNSDNRQFTRGGQITFHNIRMWFQVNNTVFKIYGYVFLVFIVLAFYFCISKEILTCSWYYLYAKFNLFIHQWLGGKILLFKVPLYGKVYSVTSQNFLKYNLFIREASKLPLCFFKAVIYGGFGSLPVLFAILKWIKWQGSKRMEDIFLRGAKLVSVEKIYKILKKNNQLSDIILDGLPLVKDSETQHILVHGSTGSGKTQLISKLLDNLKKRGDRVFIYDRGGVFTSNFYREGVDKILNPFDARSENWDLWKEATTYVDFKNIAESLIPSSGNSDPFWVNAARTIFSNTAMKMAQEENPTIKLLFEKLIKEDLASLNEYLKGTAGYALTKDKMEKTAMSIRSILATNVEILENLERLNMKKPKFSLNSLIKNDEDKGWLFISSRADQHISTKPLISMWLSIATLALLALPANSKRRIWFICDELPSLHRLPQLAMSIAEARKYGGCFVLGMQSSSQLLGIYGKEKGDGILNSLNTKFLFRSVDMEAAEFSSKALGNEEIEKMQESYSYGANSIRDGVSLTSQRIVTPIVSATEFTYLAPLNCYVRLADECPATKLKIQYQDRKEIAQPFIPQIDLEQNINCCKYEDKRETEEVDNVSTDIEVVEEKKKEQSDVIKWY